MSARAWSNIRRPRIDCHCIKNAVRYCDVTQKVSGNRDLLWSLRTVRSQHRVRTRKVYRPPARQEGFEGRFERHVGLRRPVELARDNDPLSRALTGQPGRGRRFRPQSTSAEIPPALPDQLVRSRSRWPPASVLISHPKKDGPSRRVGGPGFVRVWYPLASFGRLRSGPSVPIGPGHFASLFTLKKE